MPRGSCGEIRELGPEPDDAAGLGDGALPQLQGHEFLVGPVFIPESPPIGPVEAGAPIERLCAQDDDEAVPDPLARLQAIADEAATDAPALIVRQDGERG